MSKAKHLIQEQFFQALRTEINLKVGYPISSKPECEAVSRLIMHDGLGLVSESTLYRFFQKNYQKTFYIHTLDQLSMFVGYKSWYDFENARQKLHEFEFQYGLSSLHSENKSLLQICIHQGLFKPVMEFIGQIPADLSYDEKIRLGFEFYKAAYTNPKSNIGLYKNIHSSKLIRTCFFELMADPTFSIPDYETGLEYYLLNVNPGNSISDLNDFIFAHTLLLRKYLIDKDKSKAKIKLRLLYEEYTLSPEQTGSLHLFPSIRYLTLRIFYYLYFGHIGQAESYAEELVHFCADKVQEWDTIQKKIAFNIVADTFVLAGISAVQQESLKSIFGSLLNLLPLLVQSKCLPDIIPYLEPSGILRYKRNYRI